MKVKLIVGSALLALILAGCAIVPLPTRSVRVGAGDALGGCAEETGVLDSGAFRVAGYPYLRVSRFLASFRGEVGDRTAFGAWVDHMQALDQETRSYEIANLPQAKGSSHGSADDTSALNARVVWCGNLLKAADFQASRQQLALRENVTVPDEYMSLWRVLGSTP
jgi:hypothetical protein